MDTFFKSCFFVLTTVACLSVQAQRNEFRAVKDIDGDGVKDSLYTFYDGGSGFGGTYGEIVNGASGKTYELDTWSCFCDSWLIKALPPEYKLPHHRVFYDTLIHRLFGSLEKQADPSLKWIFDAHTHNTKLGSSSVYESVLTVPISYHEKPESYDISYSVKADKESLKKYFRTYAEEPDWLDDSPKGLIRKYNGFLAPKKTIEHKNGKLLAANHGIAIQRKDGKIAWLFVTDPIITGGPEKMRWPSIGEIQVLGDLIIFELNMAPAVDKYIYVINTKTGRVGKLNTISEKNFDSPKDGISISNDILYIHNEEDHRYSKEELLNGLRALD